MSDTNFNIGINASMLDEKPTGVGVYTLNIINNLHRLYKNSGERITVFTPYAAHLHKEIQTVKLHRYIQASRYGGFAALTRFLWNTFIYPFKAAKFNVLISPTTHGSFLLPNQIITIHDLLSLRFNNISRHQKFYFKYFLPFIISRCRYIVAISETTKSEIKKYFKVPDEKIHVIYNGYNDQEFHKAPVTNVIEKRFGVSKYILAVGPTYPHKNFETLFNAYASLSNSFKADHKIVITGGRKTYLQHLRSLAQELGIEKDIHFLGYINSELMPELYREAAVLVYPSLYEGFGFPLVEAMACGCPVIASNTSSMPEVCGDAAVYFEPEHAAVLTLKLELLLSDPALRDQKIAEGYERVKRFSWQKTAEGFKNLIDHSR